MNVSTGLAPIRFIFPDSSEDLEKKGFFDVVETVDAWGDAVGHTFEDLRICG